MTLGNPPAPVSQGLSIKIYFVKNGTGPYNYTDPLTTTVFPGSLCEIRALKSYPRLEPAFCSGAGAFAGPCFSARILSSPSISGAGPPLSSLCKSVLEASLSFHFSFCWLKFWGYCFWERLCFGRDREAGLRSSWETPTGKTVVFEGFRLDVWVFINCTSTRPF